jgi:hypothetical protein
MSKIRIDKGIPMPRKFPFEEMEVGDSFVVPPDTHRTTVNIAAKRFGDKHNMKFATRTMPDRTLRCWRIA